MKIPLAASTLKRYKSGFDINSKHSKAKGMKVFTGGNLTEKGVKDVTKHFNMEQRPIKNIWKMRTADFPGDHFAAFPFELARRCILLSTDPGDLVLDPFSGTGTTLAVADVLGRKWIGIDINPKTPEMFLMRRNSIVSDSEGNIHGAHVMKRKAIETKSLWTDKHKEVK